MGKWKIGNYKEDSTRGRAIMRPRKYKGDSLVQAWIDRRWLASLSLWLENNGIRTRHMSDVLRESLGILYDHLIDSGEISEIDTETAGEILDKMYKIDLNPGGRGKRNLLHNKILSTYRNEKIEFNNGYSNYSNHSCNNEGENESNGLNCKHEDRIEIGRVKVSENDPLVSIAKRAAERMSIMREFMFDPSKVDNSKVVKRDDEIVDEEARKRKAMFDACKTMEEKLELKRKLEREAIEKIKREKEEKEILEKLERKRLRAIMKMKEIDELMPRRITDEEWRERERREKEQIDLLNSDAMLSKNALDGK